MASPTYGRMVMLANDAQATPWLLVSCSCTGDSFFDFFCQFVAVIFLFLSAVIFYEMRVQTSSFCDPQVALKEIRMTAEVKIPYVYSHTLSAIVHLNNILCAISMGMTLGACIGALLTNIDSKLTLYGIESQPTVTASQTLQLLLVQSLKCFFVPLLYQACLEICFCLYSAFGGETDEARIPSDRMVDEWSNELAGLMELAAHPPHWTAPAFKHAISHVPDIGRTMAQVAPLDLMVVMRQILLYFVIYLGGTNLTDNNFKSR